MNVSVCGRVLGWAELVTEVLRRKAAAFTLPLKERTCWMGRGEGRHEQVVK